MPSNNFIKISSIFFIAAALDILFLTKMNEKNNNIGKKGKKYHWEERERKVMGKKKNPE